MSTRALPVKYVADTGEPADVTFWTGGFDYARYLRAEMPARALGAHVADPASRPSSPLSLQQGRVAVWQRVATLSRANLINQQKNDGIRTLLEIDDDYTALHREHGWVEKLTPNFPPDQACVELHRMVAGHVDRVIVTTPYLAEIYGDLNDDVVVCRNAIDPEHWPSRRNKTDDRMVFVWIGSADHLEERAMASRAFQPLRGREDTRCVWMGVPPFASDSDFIEYVPWIDSWDGWRTAAAELVPDVGVAPLNDARLNLGRSDLKALEYAALGALPVVQDHLAYRELQADMAMKVSTVDWPTAVQWCADHPDEVSLRGALAAATVYETRTIGRTLHQWQAAVTFQ